MPGRGEKGSQRWIRWWINKRHEELNARLLAWESLADFLGGPPEWLSPLAPRYIEFRDNLWTKLELPGDPPHKRDWWPNRGPVWDGIARLRGKRGGTGVLLVEAKSHAHELRSKCAARNKCSVETIDAALAKTKKWLGVRPDLDWKMPYYQMANRLAFLYYLRQEAGTPAWLLLIHFTGDRFRTGNAEVVGPASEEEWAPIIRDAHQALGLAESHLLSRYVRELCLPATIA
jgi:hypothetical protein